MRERIPGLPFSVIRFAEVDSTSRFLKEWGRESAEDGVVAVAECQTAGRGRQGRRWESPAGEGLYFSILAAPVATATAAFLPLLAGVVAYDSVAQCFPALQRHIDLKWPNDLLLRGRKLAGILVELERSQTGVPFAVLGVGINCNQKAFPPELPDATSLRLETGVEADRDLLLRVFLDRWNRGYARCASALPRGEISVPDSPGAPKQRRTAPAFLIADWKARSGFWSAKAVRFPLRGEIAQGLTRDVALSGALVVELASGETVELFSSDLDWIREQ